MNALRPLVSAALLLATPALAHAAPIVINPRLPGLTEPVNILDTGKSFEQSWDGLDFDAKRDIPALGGTINAVNAAAAAIPRFGFSVDANASAHARVLAYARQPGFRLGGQSMGVRAQADFTTYASVPGFSRSVAPMIAAEASYVRPSALLCRLGSVCDNSPYYHELVELRDFSTPMGGRATPLLNESQPDPLTSQPKKWFTTYMPSIPSYEFGYGPATVTVATQLFAELGGLTSWTLSPSGGDVSLDAFAHASITALLSSPGNVLSGSLTFDILAGPYTSDVPELMNKYSARAHAGASLAGVRTLLAANNGSICGRVNASLQVERIGAYSVNVFTPFSPLVSESSEGYAYRPADVRQSLGCISL